jgi:large subunit ribosomal protein L10
VPLKREVKQAIISEVRNIADTAFDAVTVEHRYLNAITLTILRAKAHEKGVYVKVIRNTLANLALEGTEFACLQAVLKGPLLFAFSLKATGDAARLLKDFSKRYDKLVIRNVVIENQLLEAQTLDRIASLPTREEAIAQLGSLLQTLLRRMLYGLLEPCAKLNGVLAALKDRTHTTG